MSHCTFYSLLSRREKHRLNNIPTRCPAEAPYQNPRTAYGPSNKVNTMASTGDNSINISNDQIKPKPTLLTLPAELRDMIYATTLYHDENAGHIAPVNPDLKFSIYGQVVEFRTLVNGQPRVVNFLRYIFPEPPSSETGWATRLRDFPNLKQSEHLTSGCDVKVYIKHLSEDEDKQIPFSGHVCSPACLA